MLSKTLIEASQRKVMKPILSLVALLNAPPLFIRPKDKARDADALKMKFAHLDGDHMTLLNTY